MFQLRDYQLRSFEAAYNFLCKAGQGEKKLFAAPVGSGKSYIELSLVSYFPRSFLITPKIEIIKDLITKLDIDTNNLSQEQLEAVALANRICTPIRLRNLLYENAIDIPEQLIFDEVHHHTANSWQSIDWLCGKCPAIGLTASPYRGSASGTKALIEQWGQPEWIISYKESFERKIIHLPRIEICPLVDDDLISIKNGEFEITTVENVVKSRLQDAATIIDSLWFNSARPTMISVPSSEIAANLKLHCKSETEIITADTPHK